MGHVCASHVNKNGKNKKQKQIKPYNGKQYRTVDIMAGTGSLAISMREKFPNAEIICIEKDTERCKLVKKDYQVQNGKIKIFSNSFVKWVLNCFIRNIFDFTVEIKPVV